MDTPARIALHLGVIHGGRLIQELSAEAGHNVTVGASSSATLQLPKSALVGQKRILFEALGSKYALTFTESMSGRVSIGDHDVDLATLREKGVAKKRGRVCVLPLQETVQGSVELGDVIVAFDFHAPPPSPAPVHLPLAVRSSVLGRFDGLMATSLATSSLAFGLLLLWLGSIPVPDEIPMDQLDDRFVQMIMPRMKEQPEVKKELKAEQAKDEAKAEKKEEKRPNPEDKEAVAARRQEVQRRVANKGVLAILGTRGAGKGAVADVFGEGRTISSDIDAAFSGIAGVEVATGANTTSRGTGGAGSSASIGTLATSGAGKVGLAEKQEARVGNVKLSETPEVDGQLNQSDIARVVRGRLTAIKECYERELKRNPQLSGKVVVRFTIDEEGRVSQAVIEENTLSDKSVGVCVAQRVERFRFPKPDGGSVTVAYPFIFAPST